jgi:fucose 4-O-acetylase-like acetyltransferase
MSSLLVDRPVAAETAQQAPVATPARTTRDPWPDNVKLVLIGLVVLGHLLSRGVQQSVPSAHALYLFVYLFHMPAFVFLAGHLSRSRELSPRALQTVVTRLLVPYIVFTVLYAVAGSLVTGRHLKVDFVNPWWLLWFLPALAGWRLLAPVVLNLRAPVAVAVAVGLGAGMLERVGSAFTLSRILALLPFFVLGAVVPSNRLRLLRARGLRVAGAVVLVVTAVAVAALHGRVAGTWPPLLWNDDYAAMDVGAVRGMLTRLALYAVGTLLTLSVLAVVPGRRRWWTAVGAASMYVYLLHGFVVRAAARSGLLDHVTSWPGVALLVAAAAILTLLFGSGPVRRLARPLVEPRLERLLRPL